MGFSISRGFFVMKEIRINLLKLYLNFWKNVFGPILCLGKSSSHECINCCSEKMSRFKNYNETFCNIITFWCIVLGKNSLFLQGTIMWWSEEMWINKVQIAAYPGVFRYQERICFTLAAKLWLSGKIFVDDLSTKIFPESYSSAASFT